MPHTFGPKDVDPYAKTEVIERVDLDAAGEDQKNPPSSAYHLDSPQPLGQSSAPLVERQPS